MFRVSTDASGAVMGWTGNFETIRDSLGRVFLMYTKTTGLTIADYAEGSQFDTNGLLLFSTYGNRANAPRTWTQFTPLTTVPEPSTWPLLGAGLLGLIGLDIEPKGSDSIERSTNHSGRPPSR